MNIEKMIFLVVLVGVCVFASFGYANEISANTGMTYDDGLQNSTNDAMEDFELISNNLTSAVSTGSTSWWETAFTLVFRIPNIIGAMFTVPAVASEMTGALLGVEGLLLPAWINTIITLVIGLVVVFSIIALIIRWRS